MFRSSNSNRRSLNLNSAKHTGRFHLPRRSHSTPMFGRLSSSVSLPAPRRLASRRTAKSECARVACPTRQPTRRNNCVKIKNVFRSLCQTIPRSCDSLVLFWSRGGARYSSRIIYQRLSDDDDDGRQFGRDPNPISVNIHSVCLSTRPEFL